MNTISAFLIAAVVLLIAAVIISRMVISRKRRSSTTRVDYVNEQIYVGNLPYHISEDDLRSYFSKFGSPHSVRIVRNFKTGRSKGFAFITYNTPNEAKAALNAHGKELQGRSMVVRIAKPRPE